MSRFVIRATPILRVRAQEHRDGLRHDRCAKDRHCQVIRVCCELSESKGLATTC